MKPGNDESKTDGYSAIRGSSFRGIGIAFANLGLATLYLLFAVANARSFLENPRLSVFLIVVTETIVAVILLTRRDPDETRHSWQTWITTTGGTLAPFFLRPIDATQDLLAGEILQVLGFALQIAAVIALNRSFGLLPAHRSVKSGGVYSFVRHPLYTAYVVTFIGYWISNQSLANSLVVVFGIAFLVMRIHHEEALLVRYPAYSQYVNRTRWRLIPSVW